MIPTVQQAFDRARAVIGEEDGDETGGVYTNSLLRPHLDFAYEELTNTCRKYRVPIANFTAFYTLPAYTAVLAPETAGITGIGDIEEIRERASELSIQIAGVVPGSGYCTVTTNGTHGFATGDMISHYGILGLSADVNDIFCVTVTGPTTYTANGCAATGTYTTGGYALRGTGWSPPLGRIVDPVFQSVPAGGGIYAFAWQRGKIFFQPSTDARQIRISYFTSGRPPQNDTDSLGYDASLNFFGLRTAGLAFATREGLNRSAAMNLQAVGARWETEGIDGGALGLLMQNYINDLQSIPPYLRTSQGASSNAYPLVW